MMINNDFRDKLQQIALENRLYEDEDIIKYLREKEPELSTILWNKGAKQRTEYLQDATDYVISHIQALTFDERIEIARQQEHTPDEMKIIKKINNEILRILKLNIPPTKIKDSINTITRILRSKNNKVNALLLHGGTNCGKTRLLEFFSSLWEMHEIGLINAQTDKGSSASNFWLQGLLSKNINIFDEVVIGKAHLSSFKQILEGSQHLSTEVKYKNAKRIKERPTLMAKNGDIFEQFDPIDKAAMYNRCHTIHFKRYFESDDKGLADLVRFYKHQPHLYRAAFVEFIIRYTDYDDQLKAEAMIEDIPEDIEFDSLFDEPSEDIPPDEDLN